MTAPSGVPSAASVGPRRWSAPSAQWRIAAGVIILVGIALSVAWLRSSPKPAAPPVPAKILYARLHDVSCVSSSRCIAVGDFLPVDKDAIGGDPDGDGQATHTLVESSVSGAWRLVPSPDL